MIKSAIKNIERTASQNIKAEQGDYIVDGLLYCGKCNTPKQCRVILFGEERTPMCLCKCMQEEREREEAERKRYEFMERIKRNRLNAFSEEKMQSWTFENADGSNSKIMSAMQNYVSNFDEFKKQGKGLLLFGNVGAGKTYAAACVANGLLDIGYPVFMTNFANIANTVSGMFEGKQAFYDGLNRYPLLVLDDLAAERKTEYMHEIVYNVINGRYNSGLPTIITTNLTWQELTHPSDITYQRTFSRVLEMCVPVKFDGADKRLMGVTESLKNAKELLGL